MKDIKIRNICSGDHGTILAVVDDWWGGRNMTEMLPKLFFLHFQDTSFIAEKDNHIVGFLVGFMSQSIPGEAYIHFAGVHPEFRRQGIAVNLYKHFFTTVANKGCKVVRCITSPINKDSISFHKHIGFMVESNAKTIEGISVVENYDGKGGDRVIFYKVLGT